MNVCGPFFAWLSYASLLINGDGGGGLEKQKEHSEGRQKKARVSGKCCRRVKAGIGEERGRMREEEESSGSGGKRRPKKARRCGGLFSWWRWALTDACCSALVRSLLSCQLDYYQGLAAGYSETKQYSFHVPVCNTGAHTRRYTHTARSLMALFFSQSHCSFRAYGHLLVLARRLNKSSFTLSISLPLLSERVFARQQSV